ncbi:50S ribosomal protein L11 methyltransferase [Paenibacillus sp. 481]|uniref:50S ribosomal protein L11 methyltransferase n=1 Tax=Paenibacillus sp. 481 TaxID=2835869 RepID=UPI001E4F9EAC|nr:50S ribosomal protein L11 methyltransferase [Paenibacillus sp. 481]UHA74186.1 50S ribosomal protein L11 methyltransferase [Paenibacillus sp. 481]
MYWHELTIHTTEQAIEMVSNFLHEAGAGGVAIEESGTLNKERDTTYGKLYDLPLNDIPEGQAVIQGYFADGSDLSAIEVDIKERIELLKSFQIDPGTAAMSWRRLHEDDWANAWKQYFKPVRVSERLTIKPSWEDYTPETEAEQIIELDPGMAFGTGTHPTTSLCLRTLEAVIQGGEDVIDVGTGSGVLAIGACKLGARHVLAIDLDPVAVQSARENVQLNGLDSSVTVREGDLLNVIKTSETQQATELGVQLPIKVVVANILAEIITLFVDDVYEALQPDGVYITSGIIIKKEHVVEEALQASGFTIEEKHYEGDWVAIVARKRS